MTQPFPGLLFRLRTWTAALSTVVLNLGAFGLKFKSVCSPGFNCHGCPWASAACPVGVFAYGSAVRTFPALAAGTILAVGAAVGRLVCGFACPFGLLQEALFRIPAPKIGLPMFARYVKYAALALLVVAFPLVLGFRYSGGLSTGRPESVDKAGETDLEIVLPVRSHGTEPVNGVRIKVIYCAEDGREIESVSRAFPDVTVPPGGTVRLPAFRIPNKFATAPQLKFDTPQASIEPLSPYDLYYCRVCPAGTLTATVPSYFDASEQSLASRMGRNWLKLSVLLFFLVLMVLVSRPFCRTFCPLGALYGLLSRLALWRVRFAADKCVECGLCSRVCPVDLDVPREVGGPECIACGDCIRACPRGAVGRKFGLAD